MVAYVAAVEEDEDPPSPAEIPETRFTTIRRNTDIESLMFKDAKNPILTKKESYLQPGVQKNVENIKVILLGESNVGKTSIFMRYIYHN